MQPGAASTWTEVGARRINTVWAGGVHGVHDGAPHPRLRIGDRHIDLLPRQPAADEDHTPVQPPDALTGVGGTVEA